MKKWFAKNRTFLLRIVGSLLAIGALLMLIHQEGWDDVGAAIGQIPFHVFIIAGAFMIVSRLFVVARWYVLLRAADIRISFWRVLLLTFTGLFSNNVLPTTIGGDLVRLAAIMSMGYDRAHCLASLAADRLVGMAGMTLSLPFGLVPLINLSISGALQSFSLVGWWKRGWNFLHRAFKAMTIYLKKPFPLFLALSCSVGNMLGIFAAIYYLIQGLNQDVSFWLVAGLYSLTYFITLIPISINGYGVQELSMSYMFFAIGGISMPASLTLAVLVRAAFIFTSLPGAITLPSVMSQTKGIHVAEEVEKDLP